MPLVKPTEYEAGKPLERYAAERKRRGIATESAGYGLAATGAGMAAGGVSNAKIAGTRIGQHSLGQAEAHLKRSGHPGAHQVGQLKKVGAWTAKHPKRSTAALAGLTGVAGGLGVMARMRSGEETGISQGIGRIKAGEAYRDTQKRALAKGLVRTALLASDADFANPKVRQGADLAWKHKKRIAAGVGLTSATGAGVGLSTAAGHREVQTRALRRLSKSDFGKKLTPKPSDIKNWAAALGGGSAVAGGGTYATAQHKKKRTAAGVVAGGLAGQGVYQGAAYGANNWQRARTGSHLSNGKINATRRGERKQGLLRTDMMDVKAKGERRQVWDAHVKSHTPNVKDAQPDWKSAHRTTPRALPYSRLRRIIGYTHSGKTGKVVGATTTVGGAALGGSVTHNMGTKSTVGKALYQRESRPSPLRAAETGVGLGMAAWGLGRSRMLGAALSHGVKAATNRENLKALQALRMAQAAQGVLRRGTAPGERAVRQIRAVNQAINAVPSAIRPEVSAAAGILLTANAHPVNRESYRPVSTDIRFRRTF